MSVILKKVRIDGLQPLKSFELAVYAAIRVVPRDRLSSLTNCQGRELFTFKGGECPWMMTMMIKEKKS